MSLRLDILTALTGHLAAMAPPDYSHDLAGQVHRGKPAFGYEKVSTTFLTLIEPEDKRDLQPAPGRPDRRSLRWELLICGVSGRPADADHPTDEAYQLLDDLLRRVAWINANTVTATPGRVARALGGLVDGSISAGAGVVLPPDSLQSRPTAVCILPIEIPLVERSNP